MKLHPVLLKGTGFSPKVTVKAAVIDVGGLLEGAVEFDPHAAAKIAADAIARAYVV